MLPVGGIERYGGDFDEDEGRTESWDGDFFNYGFARILNDDCVVGLCHCDNVIGFDFENGSRT